MADALQLQTFTIAAGRWWSRQSSLTAYIYLLIISGDIIRQLEPVNISGNNTFSDQLSKEYESYELAETFP